MNENNLILHLSTSYSVQYLVYNPEIARQTLRTPLFTLNLILCRFYVCDTHKRFSFHNFPDNCFGGLFMSILCSSVLYLMDGLNQ